VTTWGPGRGLAAAIRNIADKNTPMAVGSAGAFGFAASRESESGRCNEADARQTKVLTPEEARRSAINVARLPELLGEAEPD
jgi:hypothetical protein